jgi:energy-coupling factor transporter ATP-binding protein EcfA2
MATFWINCLLLFLLTPPAGEKTTLIKHLAGKITAISSDELQNLYLIKNEVLEKYDAQGNFLYSYSDNTAGPISFVDPADPMKALVFYRTFAQFVVLDNTLTISGPPVPLQNYGYEQVTLGCTSYDKGYWFYNPANFEMIHMTAADLIVDKTTGNISQLLGESIHPNYLLEQNNRVFLNDPEKGIFVFDIYGAYYKTIPIKGLSQFQVSGEKVIYLEGKKINTYNFKTLVQDIVSLPDSTATSIRIEKERMFLLNAKGVDVYRVN